MRPSPPSLSVDEAAAQGDLDELIRHVDRLTDEQDWTELVRLRDKAKAAIERGFQLWPAASYAEYRMALEAPATGRRRCWSKGPAGWPWALSMRSPPAPTPGPI